MVQINVTKNKNFSFYEKSIMAALKLPKNWFTESFTQFWAMIISYLQFDRYMSKWLFPKNMSGIILLGQKSGVWNTLFKIY